MQCQALLEETREASTMSDPYGVTVSIFILAPIIAFMGVGISLSIGLFSYILKKDPTIGWRAKRKSWGWDFWVSPANDIKVLPVMEEDVDSTTNTFDYVPSDQVGYTHSISDNKSDSMIEVTKENAKELGINFDESQKQGVKYVFRHKEMTQNEKKELTQFTHKGHPAWIHKFDAVGPHAFTSNSLEPRLSPEAVYRTKDGNVRKQIDTIRITDKIHKTDVTLAILVIFVLIVAIAVYAQSSQIANVLNQHWGSGSTSNNSTSSSTNCPSGYILNSLGRCVPQTISSSLVGLLSLPFNITFSPTEWRKIVKTKTRSWVISILSAIFLPSISLLFVVSKSYRFYTVSGGLNYDYSVVFVVSCAIFSALIWLIGSKIGDEIFKLRTKWFKYSNMSLDSARDCARVFNQDTSEFWFFVEQSVRIERWLSFFISHRPTAVYVGVCP